MTGAVVAGNVAVGEVVVAAGGVVVKVIAGGEAVVVVAAGGLVGLAGAGSALGMVGFETQLAPSKIGTRSIAAIALRLSLKFTPFSSIS